KELTTGPASEWNAAAVLDDARRLADQDNSSTPARIGDDGTRLSDVASELASAACSNALVQCDDPSRRGMRCDHAELSHSPNEREAIRVNGLSFPPQTWF